MKIKKVKELFYSSSKSSFNSINFFFLWDVFMRSLEVRQIVCSRYFKIKLQKFSNQTRLIVQSYINLMSLLKVDSKYRWHQIRSHLDRVWYVFQSKWLDIDQWKGMIYAISLIAIGIQHNLWYANIDASVV